MNFNNIMTYKCTSNWKQILKIEDIYIFGDIDILEYQIVEKKDLA